VTDTNVFQLCQPEAFAVPLTEVLRNGARTLLAHAVEAEVAGFLSVHSDKLTGDGHQRLVRHGYLPEREIMTDIGPVAVRCPRVCDRIGEGCQRIRFSSATIGRHNWKGGEHNSPNRLHDRLFSRTAVSQ
jgi:putative transposase